MDEEAYTGPKRGLPWGSSFAPDKSLREDYKPPTNLFATDRPSSNLFATTVSPEPIHISLQININVSLAASDTTVASIGRKPAFGGPKSIASFMLPNDRRGCALQLVVIISYITIATYTLKSGLVAFLLALLVLKVYGFAVTELGWEGDSTDILIAPMNYLGDTVVDWMGRAAAKTIQVAVKALVDALQDVASEVEVEVKNE